MNYIRESFYRKVAEKRFGLDEGFWDTAKTAGKAVGTAARFIPGIGTAISAGMTAHSLYKGDYKGAALNAASMIPGPVGWAATAGSVAHALTNDDDDNKPAVPGTAQAAEPKLPPGSNASTAPKKPAEPAPSMPSMSDTGDVGTPPQAVEPKLPPGSNASADDPDDPREGGKDSGRPAPSTVSTARSEVGASAQAKVPDDRLKPATPSGDESAGLNMNKPNYGPNKPAAQQQAAPPSVRPRPAPSPVSTADTGGADSREGGSGSGRNDTEYDRQKQSALASAKNTASAFGPGTQTAAAPRAAARPAPRASAPAAARPEIRRTGVDGTESAQDFNYNQASGAYNEPKAAAAPRAARAAPDASDSSSGANELRSKQQAVDRGTSNLGESKSKYMNESITFERFLRKNKYGKNF